MPENECDTSPTWDYPVKSNAEMPKTEVPVLPEGAVAPVPSDSACGQQGCRVVKQALQTQG